MSDYQQRRNARVAQVLQEMTWAMNGFAYERELIREDYEKASKIYLAKLEKLNQRATKLVEDQRAMRRRLRQTIVTYQLKDRLLDS